MPIPMPPPPPPYVAPDLRPIVATEGATLVFHRRPGSSRVTRRSLDHGLWIAAEGAPLELRFHRRADGTVWGEQATYPGGDRMGGIARISAAAHEQVLSRRLVGGMGIASNVVRYTVLDQEGRRLRTWTAPACGSDSAVRLDRDGSPQEPTFPSSWYGCGNDGAYVLGRLVALDHGWAMRAPRAVARSVRPLAAGRYSLRIELDPLQGIAQVDRSNDTATVPLTVRSTTGGTDGFGSIEEPPFPAVPAAPRSRHHHASPEPQWYAARLRRLEERVDVRRLQRVQGPVARADASTAPPADVDLPDLRTAPSYGISIGSVRRAGRRRDLLRFGALTWNAGPGALEVEAFRETGTTLSAYQVFLRDGERAARQARGTLVWHAAPGHDHFHFAAFARYQLTRMDGSVVRDGGKHSWCIVDTDLVDTTVPGVGAGQRGIGSSGDCGSDPGSLWARLSLSVGAGDYYGPDIAGQAFDVTGLPNGLYRIRIEANPTGVIAETSHANNASSRVVRIGGRPGRRIVVPRPVATVTEDAWGGGTCFDEKC